MAEYQGKEVELDNPFRLPKGSDKKFGVYVKNKKGNVVKVEFGDPNMEIKRDDPERLKNFRARHNCDQKKDKTKAGYWSCKFWEKGKSVSDLLKDEKEGCGCGCNSCMKEQKIRTQVEFDTLNDAIKSVKFHPTRDKGREVAIYKMKDGTFTPVTLPNGPFEKILKAKGAKRVAKVKNVDGKTKVFKEQKLKATPQKKFRGRSPGVKKTTGHSLRFKVTSKLAQKMQEILSGEDKAELKRYNRLVTSTDIDGDEVVLTFGSAGARTKVTQMLKENVDVSVKERFFAEKKNPKDTKYYTKTGKIKKSPEDKETGLPKKYVSRMTTADAKQKAAEIKARKKYGKDDPRRYKPTNVDKKYAGTSQKSKHTKKYEKMFGKKGSK